jgi:hypothetical protein
MLLQTQYPLLSEVHPKRQTRILAFTWIVMFISDRLVPVADVDLLLSRSYLSCLAFSKPEPRHQSRHSLSRWKSKVTSYLSWRQ